MKYKFTKEITVGDLTNSVTIDSLEISSISFNFEPERSQPKDGKDPHAVMSVVLHHKESLHKINIVIKDSTALDFWNQINAAGGIDKAVFQKIADKLPAGDIIS